MSINDFRTDAAPDVSLREAMTGRAFYTIGGKEMTVHIKWLDDVTLEYAVSPRSGYETNVSHSGRCWLKARLPIDRAMAWTRERRMSAKKIWVTTEPDPLRPNDKICSHRIVFKSPDHAFEFRLSWT